MTIRKVDNMMRPKIQIFPIVITLILIAFFADSQGIADTGLVSDPEQKEEISLTHYQYDSRGKRDPFISLLHMPGLSDYAKTGDESDDSAQLYVRLEGIVWDPIEPLALVNDKVVRVNDEYDNMKILKIDPEAIVVLFKGKEYRFALDRYNEM